VAAELRPPTTRLVVAQLRPDPENKTHNPPPPTPSQPSTATTTWREEDILTRCGITDLDVLVEHCLAARRAPDKSTGRWTRHTLLAAIQLALSRGWPGALIEPALLTVASDPATRSPMGLVEASPWWDTIPTPPGDAPEAVRYPRAVGRRLVKPLTGWGRRSRVKKRFG